MALVDSLLTAIVRADGDALVMHVGERPYVVAPAGPVELSSRPLTLEAVSGMLGQLLPNDARTALDELGAVEHAFPASAVAAGERFTVVAARGGDDIWIEVRRRRRPAPVVPPEVEFVAPLPPLAEATPVPAEIPAAPVELSPEPEVAAPVLEVEIELPADDEPTRPIPPLSLDRWRPEVEISQEPAVEAEPGTVAGSEPPKVAAAPAPAATAPEPPVEPPTIAFDLTELLSEPEKAETLPEPAVTVEPSPAPVVVEPAAAMVIEVHEPVPAEAPEMPQLPSTPPPIAPRPAPLRMPPPAVVPPAAVVLPTPKEPARAAMPAPSDVATGERAGRLLQRAASRGAQALFLVSGTRPTLRVDGGISAVADEAELSAADVECLVAELISLGGIEPTAGPASAEWTADIPDLGKVRFIRFRDHRGPGCVARLLPAKAPTAEQLGLSREILSLAAETDGLIIVATPRAAGKSTLVSALVDLINRSRGEYIVTFEREVRVAHAFGSSFVSQREIPRGEDLGPAVWSAMHEEPDVIVLDELRSASALEAALDAAEAGRLVIASVLAHGAVDGLGRLLSLVPRERRAEVQQALAATLRGVVSQVLLAKSGGGRVAARELLLNANGVAALLAGGHLDGLPAAIDTGRAHGMVPLTDALLAFVQSGAVDVREAYRRAFDRYALLAALRREGLDTSFVERLA